MSYQVELQVIEAALREAGAVAQRSFGARHQVQDKGGGEGPVSEVDRACDALLRDRIARAFPDDAILSEETADDGAWQRAARAWMIDPIDGTQEYVAGVDQYAIMVGLCVDGAPTVGGVLAPAQDLLLLGAAGEGAWVQRGAARGALCLSRVRPAGGWTIVESRSHPDPRTEQLCQALRPAHRFNRGSVGLKAATVALGEADLYLAATSMIKLWDTCGPQAVLVAAGGAVVDLLGAPLDYRRELRHPHGVLACAAAHLEPLLEVITPLARGFYS